MSHDQLAHNTKDQRWIDILPESFWVAGAFGSGGAAGLGFAIDFTAAMKEQEQEALPQREDVRLVESVGGDEKWYEKLEDSFHVHVETLAPSAFLAGAERFLRSVGLDGLTQVSVNEESLPEGKSGVKMDLKQAVGNCAEHIGKEGRSVQTIEITSHGRNETFSFLTDFAYTRKHRPTVPPIELEVQVMSNELGPRKGESFADYRLRMNALDSDLHRKEEIYDRIEAGKKAVYSDFAHHLSEAFPGVRLQFYERQATGGA